MKTIYQHYEIIIGETLLVKSGWWCVLISIDDKNMLNVNG